MTKQQYVFRSGLSGWEVQSVLDEMVDDGWRLLTMTQERHLYSLVFESLGALDKQIES